MSDTKTYPGDHARHCAACDQYGDPSGVAQWDEGCPGLNSARPEPTGDETWRAVDVDRLELLDAEFPETCCERVLLAVNRADGGRFVCLGWWDAETQRWFDEETDGQNDRVVYSPGEVTHWRALPAMPGAESKALPPSGALGLAREIESLTIGQFFTTSTLNTLHAKVRALVAMFERREA